MLPTSWRAIDVIAAGAYLDTRERSRRGDRVADCAALEMPCGGQTSPGVRIPPSPLGIQFLGLTSTGLQNAAPAARCRTNVSTFRRVAAAASAAPNLVDPLLRWHAAPGP